MTLPDDGPVVVRVVRELAYRLADLDLPHDATAEEIRKRAAEAAASGFDQWQETVQLEESA